MMMWKIRFKGRILRSSQDPQNSVPILVPAYPLSLPSLAPFLNLGEDLRSGLRAFGQGIPASQEFRGMGSEGTHRLQGVISPDLRDSLPNGEEGGQRRTKMHKTKAQNTEQDSTWSNLSVVQIGRLEAAYGFLIIFLES